jgi:DNA-binding beta-propeller fold protein YncE
MRTRLTRIVAFLALVSIAVLMACSTKYSSSNDGLVVVTSQGGEVINNQGGPAMETFSLDLANGHLSEINNVNGPPTNGLPTAVVLDPPGTFAYVIVEQNASAPGSSTGIQPFPVASDGKLGAGTVTTLNNTAPVVTVVCMLPNSIPQDIMVGVQPTPVVPVALAIDSAGKFMFVADAATSAETLPYTCNGTTTTSTVPVPGTVSVLAVSSGTLTEVAGSPFPLPTDLGANTASASALAVTPTIYPALYAPCSGFTPPTTENLYVTDSVNYVLLNYLVTSNGSLSPVLPSTTVGVPTGQTPDGVAVDPCNRFVYVANGGPSNDGDSVSAFTICSTANTVVQPTCSGPNFSLNPVKGSPFSVSPGNGPGPLAVDAYGNFLYVVDTESNLVSAFKLNPTTGALTPLSPPAVSAGAGANSIAIRSDDSWLFVANTTAATLSQYGITPSTGTLTAQPPISTFNLPAGVAVK